MEKKNTVNKCKILHSNLPGPIYCTVGTLYLVVDAKGCFLSV